VINGVYAWQVREDLLGGLNRGIKNAPAVFINGELFEEDVSRELLGKKIEEYR
jgi:hypothetical protein